jgi:hypothetical protein
VKAGHWLAGPRAHVVEHVGQEGVRGEHLAVVQAVNLGNIDLRAWGWTNGKLKPGAIGRFTTTRNRNSKPKEHAIQQEYGEKCNCYYKC